MDTRRSRLGPLIEPSRAAHVVTRHRARTPGGGIRRTPRQVDGRAGEVSVTPARAPSRPAVVTAGALLLGVLVAACESPMAPTACGPLPQVTVHAGETVSVTACLNDPNGDALGYALASSNPSVATASLAGSVVNVDAVAPGSATITVTARDAGGLQGQASFGVVVPNRPPRARGSMAPPEAVAAAAAARAGRDLQVLFSRGIPSREREQR